MKCFMQKVLKSTFEKIELDKVHESPLNSLHIFLPHFEIFTKFGEIFIMFNFGNFEKWRQNWAQKMASQKFLLGLL